MNEKTFWGTFMAGCFTRGLMIMQGGKLMIKRFQMSVQVSFPPIDSDLGY